MLTDLDYFALEYICLNMRERDKQEIFSLRNHDSGMMLAGECWHWLKNQGHGRIAWAKGKPVAVVGFTELWPGVFEVIMFGTDDFKLVALELLRWIRQHSLKVLDEYGGHRMQATSLADYTEAHEMMLRMGGVKEGEPMKNFGKHGESYQRFVWLKGHNEQIKSGMLGPKEAA